MSTSGDCVLYGNLGDAHSHFEGVRRLLDDRSLADTVAAHARKAAVQLDFEIVSRDLSSAIASQI